jgi:hypothetical protein
MAAVAYLNSDVIAAQQRVCSVLLNGVCGLFAKETAAF